MRTLAFVRSRRGAEVVAPLARRALDEAVPGLGDRVAAYRAGYLREERRELERALLDGALLGLASTNALELGVDLAGLDAVLIWPAIRARWRRCGSRPAGPAGPAARRCACWWPATTRWTPTWCTTRRRCSAARSRRPCSTRPTRTCSARNCAAPPPSCPLTAGRPGAVRRRAGAAAVEALVAGGALRRRPTGWYWTHRGRPDVDLRGTGGAPVSVVESATGRLLGTVDPGSSHFMLHAGAVYLHQGVSYVVDELDLDDAVALVHAEEPDWTTHARDVTTCAVRVGALVRGRRPGRPVPRRGGRDQPGGRPTSAAALGTGEVIDTRPLDLPARELRTVAVWCTVSPEALAAAGVDPADVPGALHAAEHAAIGLLPLVATCDRWDIGGLSTALHPDTEAPTVFVYDGHPGGAGFAERAYARGRRLARRPPATAIAECGCETGCPSCVQSPKCGNGNNPLDKAGAVRVLDLVLGALAGRPPRLRRARSGTGPARAGPIGRPAPPTSPRRRR